MCRSAWFDDPEWQTWWRALAIPSDTSRHRKAFEWVHLVFGLESLGVLGADARVLSVGAGHEYPLYYLANRSAMTVASDLYEHSGLWTEAGAQEGAPDFARDPARYAPFAYRRDALQPAICDGRMLSFADDSFDVVYSLSSIEHFGGEAHRGAIDALAEMARVTRPRGVVAVATEIVLAGGPHPEFFEPDELRAAIDEAGLEPIGPLDLAPPEADLVANPVDPPDGEYDGTHIVLGVGDLRWTSVMLFLRPRSTPNDRLLLVRRRRDEARTAVARLGGTIGQRFGSPAPSSARAPDGPGLSRRSARAASWRSRLRPGR